ncbi:SIS domain-containing protein [Streptomyces sp. JJ36]|uniref:SIS domain-containing protein n=1 Tax=Streptomyces sp. JJ36 TaxID=2736645 RepID=UPI001F3D6FBE|nr:SIS domain-containing protein [Streptomyces sp. JJ36]MCF6524002.1 mannose-6-phosphate isomerase [Streptomyces sp. JJ36]
MLDESLLDAPEALARADVGGLLRGAAESGSRVRTAVRLARESGLAELRPDGRPRSVLVAGYGPVAGCVADLLGAFCNGGLPVSLLRPTGALAVPAALRWALPGWAGPLDLLLLVTAGGDEPGLTALVEQAYRRGCTVVAVAPDRSPLTETVGETHGLSVPMAPGPYATSTADDVSAPPAPAEAAPGEAGADARQDGPVAAVPVGTVPPAPPEGPTPAAVPGTLWALLAPLLALTDRLGVVEAPQRSLEALADRLDRVAERCGPAIDTYSNPGKNLATELSGALPLLWSEGAVAGAAARHWATTLAALAGRPALPARLPEALIAHGPLLADAFTGGGADDDFFRDRVEEPEALHTRVVLLREGPPGAESAAVAARDLTYEHDTPLSELEPDEGSGPLEAAAELIATGDFASVYLTLALTRPS